GKIGNFVLTHEDYDQIDPEDMEMMDLRWSMENIARRVKKFMQITGRTDLLGKDSNLRFDMSKVQCFNSGEYRHF
ncbi:MAG: hypothetical protein Q8755_03435, partial [Candidatus Phytoplasma australasiaticum]|nr:hypothetical protein [Candidatus Phytoplasma australasiaticum]